MPWCIRRRKQDALTAARHRAFIAPRLIGSFTALASFPVYVAFRGAAERARSRRLRLAGGADPDRLFPLAHRPLRKRACAFLAGARRAGDGGRRDDRRHRLVRRDLAGGGAAGSRTVGVAPRGGAGLDRGARRRRSAAAAERLRPAAAAGSDRQRARRARRARHHLGFALRHRPCARRRAARAHRRLAALCRGRPLSSARAQHDRRHHPARPQRRGAVRFAGGGAAVRRARAGAERPRPVRPRACRRPAGLSHRACRRSDVARGPLGRIPHPPR